jgi:HlyD family secretion protein
VKPAVRWTLVLVAVVAVVVVLRATACRPKGIEVETARAERGVVEDVVTNSEAGTVRARERARLGAEQAGRVRAIPKREGASFETGDVLVELDSDAGRLRRDLARRDLDAARHAAEQARAAAALALRTWERVQPLAEQGLISPGERDAARARHDEAEAARRASESREESAASALGIAEETLRQMRILAPFDGVVSQRFIEVGETVVPGQAAVEVLNPRRLYVSAPLDEMDIARVQVGLPARVSLDPYPDREWGGTVSRVAPFVNDVVQQNRTLEIEVELALDEGGPLPKAGTSADVEIILDRREGVLRVPTFSVIEGKRVLAIERGRAVSKDVATGLRNWEWTEIASGLSEGQMVVTSLDVQGVKAGVAVRPKPGTGAAGAAGRAEADSAATKARAGTR